MHDQLDWAPIHKAPTQDGGAKKLYPWLGPIEGHCLHLSLLRQYLKMGMKIRKVNRIWLYEQRPYLEKHVKEMAAKRNEAKSEVMKDTLKLCCVSYYGCTIENMANRKDLVPYADEYKYELDCARLWRPGLRCRIQYKYDNGDFLGFRERRPQNGIVLRTPRIVGSGILDLAKVHM